MEFLFALCIILAIVNLMIGITSDCFEVFNAGFAFSICVVCAICAAPVIVLSPLGILKNKKFTCYPTMENDFAEFAGDSWQEKVLGSIHQTDNVVIDDTLITSRGAGTALEFSFAIIEKLCGKETMEKVKSSIVA